MCKGASHALAKWHRIQWHCLSCTAAMTPHAMTPHAMTCNDTACNGTAPARRSARGAPRCCRSGGPPARQAPPRCTCAQRLVGPRHLAAAAAAETQLDRFRAKVRRGLVAVEQPAASSRHTAAAGGEGGLACHAAWRASQRTLSTGPAPARPPPRTTGGRRSGSRSASLAARAGRRRSPPPGRRLAVGETSVILLHPPLLLVGVQ